MSEGERDPAGRRLRSLLDRLAVEEDPKEAARLMREVAELTEALDAGAPGCASPCGPARPDTS